MPAWIAKNYGKSRIQNPQLKPPKLYLGLAFLSAEVVRKHKSSVVDSREEYLGHADIIHGFSRLKKGEARPPHEKKQLNARASAIAAEARFVIDSHPLKLYWREES